MAKNVIIIRAGEPDGTEVARIVFPSPLAVDWANSGIASRLFEYENPQYHAEFVKNGEEFDIVPLSKKNAEKVARAYGESLEQPSLFCSRE